MSKENPNISKIFPWLFVGNRKAAKDKRLLMSLGVKRVLNVTPSKEEDPRNGVPNFHPKAFGYKRIAVYDNTASSLSDHFEAGVSYLEIAKCYGNVFVHCLQGRSRSVSIVVAFLIKVKGFSVEEGLAYVRSRRPIAEPNEKFLEELEQWEALCKRSGGGKGGPGSAAGASLPSVGPPMRPSKEGGREPAGASASSPAQAMAVAGPQARPTAVGPAAKPMFGPSPGPMARAGGRAGPVAGPSKKPASQPPSSAALAAHSKAGPSVGPSLPPSRAKKRERSEEAQSRDGGKKRKKQA